MKKLPYLISIGLIIFFVITGNNVNAQELPGACQDCPPDGFKTQNFLEYAQEQFSDKFPFDAIEINGGTGAGQCMTLNNNQECQVKEALGNFLSIVKFPIWITFLLSLIKVV